MRPKFKIALFKGKTLRDGSHPIMVHLHFNSRVKRYSTGLSCRPDQWHVETQRLFSNYPHYDKKNSVLNAIELKIDTILDEYIRFDKPFSLQPFEVIIIDECRPGKLHTMTFGNTDEGIGTNIRVEVKVKRKK